MKKTILITGATSGMGFASAKLLAKAGHSVIGTGRSVDKCHKAELDIKNEGDDIAIKFLICDQSSLSAVRELADSVKSLTDKLDTIICNAATVSSWYIQTIDGIELQFAVNHLSHFLLIHLLKNELVNSDSPRILNVSSRSHRNTVLNWKNIMMNRRYGCLKAYKRSKLCNVLFTHSLNRRLAKVSSFSIDPGLINTELGLKNTSGIVNSFWSNRMQKGRSPEKASETIIFLATQTNIPNNMYTHYKYCKPLKPSKYSLKIENAERLWSISEKYCCIESKNYGL